MHGRLEIQFERQEEKTIARTIHQQAPLKVIKPFYPEGDSPAHLYILNTTGGILEGDRMEINLHFGNKANVLVIMPSATKVHPSSTGDARQKLSFRLEKDSVLEYFPEPLLPFSGAAFLQETDIFLEDGAVLFWGDILGPGRREKGELFAYRLYENQMTIADRKGFIARECFRLEPSITPINGTGVMEGYSHMGSLYVLCGDQYIEALLQAFRTIKMEGLFWGLSLLSRRGLFVRALSHETPELQDFFMKFWALFRKIVLGRMLPPIRRY